MSEALAAVSAAPPSSPAKGLMEQENASPEPGGERTFADLVDALLPVAALPAAGGELPVTDVPLPAEIATDALPGDAVPFAAMIPFADAGSVRASPLAGADAQWASSNRLLSSRAAAGATVARAADRLATSDTASGAATGSDFGDAWRDFGLLDAEPDPLQALGAAAQQAPAANTSSPEAGLHGLHGLAAVTERAAAAEAPKLVLDSRLPVLHSAFAERFSEQVTVLVEHGVKHAQLSLNPADLGPIEVRISFHQDEATIQFASHHPAARDAMADALPRLREMLDGAGVRLGESGVFAQLPQREQPAAGQPAPNLRESATAPWREGDEVPVAPGVRVLRLVDAYA